MHAKQRLIRRLRIIMPAVAIMVLVIVAPLDLLPAWIAPLPDTIEEQAEQAIEFGLDGIIVYVDKAGEPPRSYAAGWKNKVAGVPADPGALFRIASISKLYMAAAVAQLADAGRVSLDRSLAAYLPELANRIEFSDAVTLRMLVQHRSGIPNFTDHEDWDWFASQTDSEQALALVLDEPADFRPGAQRAYSNTNYLLIGRILDRVLGEPHPRYIQREILAPLGLTDTFSDLGQAEHERVVSGYWYGFDDDLRQLDHVIPGGSMVATAADVARFVRALNDGTLLGTRAQAIYTGLYEYGHDGWIPGYHSIARYDTDLDAVVVQFVNTTGGETWGLATIVGGKATALSSIVHRRVVRILNRS